MAFNCTIVTPEAQVFDQQVTQAIIPAYDGLVGVLTGRAPMLVKLGVGSLRLTVSDGSEKLFCVDGGVAQMKANKLTILTSQAAEPQEIDAESASAELAEALARRITDQKSFDDRQHAIARARARQEMA
ncbi:MAG: ATP synthase F1 subunit epsilon, partial [Tepidisphaeraceae bacterium]